MALLQFDDVPAKRGDQRHQRQGSGGHAGSNGYAGSQRQQQCERLEGPDNLAQPFNRQRSLQCRPEPSGSDEHVPHEPDGQNPGTDERRRRAGKHEDQRGIGLDIQPASRGARTRQSARNGPVHRVKNERGRTEHHHGHTGNTSGEQCRNRCRRTACHQDGPDQGYPVRRRGQPGLAVEDGGRGISQHGNAGAYRGKASGRYADDYASMAIAGIWFASARGWYRDLWDRINGAGAWDKNPWVVAPTFTVIKFNIDQVPA